MIDRDRDRIVVPLLVRTTFPDTSVLECAVSGGADSTAMLMLAAATSREVVAHHVDHGLRPGSGRDAEVVEAVATRVGARLVRHSVAVEPGPNLEARARAARHAVLPSAALFAHTADDQAETLLLQLLRGAGPTGLAAISTDRHPILDLRRAETHAVCERLGIDVVRDPTNDDAAFTRNRIRHEVLPMLADVSGRDPVPLLCRAARHQRSVVSLVAMLASEVDPTVADVLTTLPQVVAAEAVRRWWCDATGSAYAPDEAAIGRVLAVARGDTRATEVSGGWRVERTARRLRLVAPGAALVARPNDVARDSR